MKIRLHEPTFGEEEIQAAVTQMRTTQVTMGPRVREFEGWAADQFGARYGLMCNSGSSANLLAVAALTNPACPHHLRPGDEVIVPALSWATTVWPIIQHGLVPVFVDCDLTTFNTSPDMIRRAITSRTRAIMLVHVYGSPCDMNPIMGIARDYHLFVIEDCCEAMGSHYDYKGVGTFGNIGTMSLYYSHHITTFEGGLAFTGNLELVELMRILRAHGWSREADGHEKYAKEHPDIDPRFLFVNIGYNLRPTEVQAAIGMVQLPKLAGFMRARQAAYRAFYDFIMRKYPTYFYCQEKLENAEANWFGFALILAEKCPFTLKDITAYLQKEGIETRPIIAGNIARHPVMRMYKHRVSGTLENCDTIMRRGFAIGCHQNIDEAAQAYVMEKIDAFMTRYSAQ